MKDLYRLIDANINRVSEGIRVLEDLARFHFEVISMSSTLRSLRHDIRMDIMELNLVLIQSRDSEHDIGLSISKKNTLDQKANIEDLITANFKRVEEGLRVIEETLKITGHYPLSKKYEDYRFRTYTLEKKYKAIDSKKKKVDCLQTDLYGITAEECSRGRDNIQVVKEMLDAGIKIIQYREKDKQMGERYEQCLKIREMTKEAGALFIVNDHMDLALAVKADGVHIGQNDMPIEKIRELVGEEMIIGLSTHSPEQGQNAIKRGADYIGVGPIFRTFTKKDVCDPVGLEYLDYVVENLDIPYVTIGGIKEHNIQEVASHGAKCIALVTEIVGAENIGEKIKGIRNKKKEGQENEL